MLLTSHLRDCVCSYKGCVCSYKGATSCYIACNSAQTKTDTQQQHFLSPKITCLSQLFHLQGYVCPGILVTATDDEGVSVLRDHWTRHALAAPPGFRIFRLGLSPGCSVTPFAQVCSRPGLGHLVCQNTSHFSPFTPLACVRIVHACKAGTRWGQCWGYLYPGAFLCRVGRLFRPNQPWTLLMQPSQPSPSARALPPPSSPHLTFPLLRVPPPHYPTPSVQSWQA